MSAAMFPSRQALRVWLKQLPKVQLALGIFNYTSHLISIH